MKLRVERQARLFRDCDIIENAVVSVLGTYEVTKLIMTLGYYFIVMLCISVIFLPGTTYTNYVKFLRKKEILKNDYFSS